MDDVKMRIFGLWVFLGSGLLLIGAPEGGIDWQRAQQLHRRERSGETLSPEDQAYLNRAKEIRARGGGQGVPGQAPANQRQRPATLKPLCDMTATDRYEGEDGGLYGGGRNVPPEAIVRAAREEMGKIRPLDAEGRDAADGQIVLVSLSMSNATQEFSAFKQIADNDPRKGARVKIIDCAQGGQAMAEWAPAGGAPWREAMARINRAGASPCQVQVAWVKLANKGPVGSMAEHLGKLEADTIDLLHNARASFPNLRIAYLGSRIWAGNARGALNPEPYAYESAFAVRKLILRQAAGEAGLARDKAPLLLWGPYLWADGANGRLSDELKWLPDDFAADGVHPSTSGRGKVARILLDWFANNPLAKGWFTR